ncbi:hypothetical protein AUS43_24675, partial [Escherichia coli]
RENPVYALQHVGPARSSGKPEAADLFMNHPVRSRKRERTGTSLKMKGSSWKRSSENSSPLMK